MAPSQKTNENKQFSNFCCVIGPILFVWVTASGYPKLKQWLSKNECRNGGDGCRPSGVSVNPHPQPPPLFADWVVLQWSRIMMFNFRIKGMWPCLGFLLCTFCYFQVRKWVNGADNRLQSIVLPCSFRKHSSSFTWSPQEWWLVVGGGLNYYLEEETGMHCMNISCASLPLLNP